MKHNILKRIITKIYVLTYIKWRNERYINDEKNSHYGATELCHITHQLTGNTGDTVLSYCVRRTLGKEGDYSWKIFGVRDEVTEKEITSYNRTNGIIIGGGGLFLPDSNENSISGWQWPCSRELLNSISVPIILYSVGYNYFRGQYPTKLFIDNLNAIVEKADFVGLRNTGSIEMVKKLLKPELREKVVFQPCTTTIIRKVVSNLPEKKHTNKVAINVAYDRIEKRLGNNYSYVLTEIAKTIKIIEDKGYEIFCVAHCSCDLEFSVYLDAQNVRYKAVNGEFWLPNKWFEFYNDMEVVLGMRGHAQMIPFGVNTKIISLGSHDKMRWFLEDIDAVDWYIELNENPETLQKRIIDIFIEIQENNSNYTEMRLLEKQENLYRITMDNANKIKNIINNRKMEEKNV